MAGGVVILPRMVKRVVKQTVGLGALLAVLLAFVVAAQPRAVVAAPAPQQAPSATPPPVRVEAIEPQGTNVRAGPGTDYDLLGTMVAGQVGEILGRSNDSAWLKITYVGPHGNEGWVFRQIVRVFGDVPTLPIAEPPPTPTLPPTSTSELPLQPGQATPTPRGEPPPTITPPAPEIRPTLLPAQGVRDSVAFPPAVLIIVLSVLGTFGGLLSVVRSRR